MLIIVTRGGIVECGCWDAYRSKIAPGAPVDPPTDELGIEVHLSLSEAEEIGLVPRRAEVERLRTIVKERAWRDATHIDPADGDEFLVAVRGSDNKTVWWELEIVTVQIGEDYFCLEVNGDSWDCDWADVAWCIPMSAMQPPEAAEAAGE